MEGGGEMEGEKEGGERGRGEREGREGGERGMGEREGWHQDTMIKTTATNIKKINPMMILSVAIRRTKVLRCLFAILKLDSTSSTPLSIWMICSLCSAIFTRVAAPSSFVSFTCLVTLPNLLMSSV